MDVDRFGNTEMHDICADTTADTVEDALHRIEALVDQGFDLNCRNELGHTPIMIAKHPDLVNFLLQHGASLEPLYELCMVLQAPLPPALHTAGIFKHPVSPDDAPYELWDAKYCLLNPHIIVKLVGAGVIPSPVWLEIYQTSVHSVHEFNQLIDLWGTGVQILDRERTGLWLRLGKWVQGSVASVAPRWQRPGVGEGVGVLEEFWFETSIPMELVTTIVEFVFGSDLEQDVMSYLRRLTSENE
eukprot:TRINITY_DN4319_c0_g1_i3.p1 TRINITY_DN4319_c0_g1~~TRINITY_DN4319_c0_g1_i3.p1  ORF type:complete len:243 (+),score=8.93 TRINITY_DN4319_c0_g1_i3:173-901(+)